MKFDNRENSFDRTIRSLCNEIDELKDDVDYWRKLYEDLKVEYSMLQKEALLDAKKSVSNLLMLTLHLTEEENGNLVLTKENRDSLSKVIKS